MANNNTYNLQCDKDGACLLSMVFLTDASARILKRKEHRVSGDSNRITTRIIDSHEEIVGRLLSLSSLVLTAGTCNLQPSLVSKKIFETKGKTNDEAQGETLSSSSMTLTAWACNLQSA